MTTALTVRGVVAHLGELEILRGVDLEVPFGEVHALMGPNGSGKSTLCHVLMGKGDYTAEGSALVDGTEIMGAPVDERAEAGLFETFQYPVEIPGVSLRELIREMAETSVDPGAFVARAEEAAAQLGMERFLDRPVNQDLSGGEKKRSEIFQLLARQPKAAILDEIDSGLDIDAVREVAEAVEAIRSPELGVVMITHYSRILKYMDVDRVHIMLGGKIVQSGGREVADHLEAQGYEQLREQFGITPIGGATPEPDPFASL